MKTNASNLEISPINEVLSKLIDYNLVSNKKISAGIDSFPVLTEEHADSQIYFSILDRVKNSSEQLTDDSQGIPNSRQDNGIPLINTSILEISPEFITENWCGSISKGDSWIPPLNIDTPQISDNIAIPSIPTNFNTPQLPKYSGTNQATKKIEEQRIAIKNYIKCEISNVDQKVKFLYECFNGIKETEKSNEMILKNFTFCKIS